MKEIKLSQGKVALVDDEDFDELNKFKWCYHSCGYACRSIRIDGKQKTIMMHRFIMNTPDVMMTDHINRNKLDNKKSNLRICTRVENQRNCSSHKGSSSKYLGVTFLNKNKNWQAQININGKNKYLGSFKTEEEAARCYNEYALKYHREFANLNKVKNSDKK